jgi:hypothetical protein
MAKAIGHCRVTRQSKSVILGIPPVCLTEDSDFPYQLLIDNYFTTLCRIIKGKWGYSVSNPSLKKGGHEKRDKESKSMGLLYRTLCRRPETSS